MPTKADGILSSKMTMDPKRMMTRREVIKAKEAFVQVEVQRTMAIARSLKVSATIARRRVIWRKTAGHCRE